MSKKGSFIMGIVDKEKYFVGFLSSKKKVYDDAKKEIKYKANLLNCTTVGVVFKG